jgi:phage terminase small subunit
VRTEKQMAFVEAYCQTGNASKSAIRAGYSEATAKQKGHELKNQFKNEIEDRIKKMIQDSIPAALNQISALAQTATSEQVRFNAAKDILDRAGLKPAERVEQRISHDEKSMDELRKELKALTGFTEPEKIPELVN